MLITARILARLRERNGFTLVETLVAMITGVVITGALFAILEVSVRQSSHLSNVAQATQLSRATMTKIVDQLHSSCLYQKFPPVKKESTSTKLILVNGYDEATAKEEPPSELPPAGIHKDVIEFNEATGKLVDVRYTATSNVAKENEYPWAAATTTTQLGENVTTPEGSKEIFKYYAYSAKANPSTTAAASTLSETSLVKGAEALSSTQAAKVAAVQITFRMGSNERKEFKLNSSTEKGTFAEQSTLSTFALMSPDSEATITAGPCE